MATSTTILCTKDQNNYSCNIPIDLPYIEAIFGIFVLAWLGLAIIKLLWK